VDNRIEGTDRAPRCQFGPDRRLTAATGALSVVAVLIALTTDRAGQVLLAGAALVLLSYTVTDLIFWPRLTVTREGLSIRAPLTRAQLPWSDIEAVRADARQRLGLRSVTLEIDAGEQLVVFSRRALGADPETAAGVIRAFDPRT
jgi:hypothetical protein